MHSGGGGCSRSGHSDAHRCARGVGGASASCPQLRLEWTPIRSGTSRRLAWAPAHLVRASPRLAWAPSRQAPTSRRLSRTRPRLARTSPRWLWKEEISKQKQPCRARWLKREERRVSWRPPFCWGGRQCVPGERPRPQLPTRKPTARFRYSATDSRPRICPFIEEPIPPALAAFKALGPVAASGETGNQTFPNGLVIDCGRTEMQRMLGNAVPSLIAGVPPPVKVARLPIKS